MKKKDLISKLKKLGWWKYDEGTNHENWTNGEQRLPVPRHAEINERTAKSIIKVARSNPGKRGT